MKITREVSRVEYLVTPIIPFQFDAFMLSEYGFFNYKVTPASMEAAFKKLVEKQNELIKRHNELVEMIFNEVESND